MLKNCLSADETLTVLSPSFIFPGNSNSLIQKVHCFFFFFLMTSVTRKCSDPAGELPWAGSVVSSPS